MKLVKFAATIAFGFTLGEFITIWRCSPSPVPFKVYSKEYIKSVPDDLKKSMKVGGLFWEGPEKFKPALNNLIQPSRKI